MLLYGFVRPKNHVDVGAAAILNFHNPDMFFDATNLSGKMLTNAKKNRIFPWKSDAIAENAFEVLAFIITGEG
ncbi:hypothetical protein G6F36_014700 [Rhizopus arrhizus]|nr:hypothetical protein G6F36_014700 [Rhizopus arrhizus]